MNRVLPAALISALTVLAIVLAGLALRAPLVEDAGGVPGPIPTWNAAKSSPEPSPPAPTPSSLLPHTNFYLSIQADGSGARASGGSCARGEQPSIETTVDSGTTWSLVQPSGFDIREVLALRSSNSSQIDLVVRLGGGCSITLLSSFTGGEYWAEYPERLGETSYVDPIDKSTVRALSAEIVTPCAAVKRVVATDSGVFVLCQDGVLMTTDGGGSWITVKTGAFEDLAVSANATTIYLLPVDGEDCGDNPSASSQYGFDIECVSSPSGRLALSASEAGITIWSTDGVQVLEDAKRG